MKKICICRIAMAFVGLTVTGLAAADQPSLDELLDLEPADTGAADQSEAGSTDAANREDLERLLSQQEAADAFDEALEAMAAAADRLGPAQDPGLPTQRLQEEALDKLDQMIEAAKQPNPNPPPSGSGSSSGSPQNQDGSANNAGQSAPTPGQGQQPGDAQAQSQSLANAGGENDGQASPGSVGAINPNAQSLEELRAEWGSLPPRLRDELTNGLDEPYSPIYREVTEQYYRRLAEEVD
jgi:hypothetical protein